MSEHHGESGKRALLEAIGWALVFVAAFLSPFLILALITAL